MKKQEANICYLRPQLFDFLDFGKFSFSIRPIDEAEL